MAPINDVEYILKIIVGNMSQSILLNSVENILKQAIDNYVDNITTTTKKTIDENNIQKFIDCNKNDTSNANNFLPHILSSHYSKTAIEDETVKFIGNIFKPTNVDSDVDGMVTIMMTDVDDDTNDNSTNVCYSIDENVIDLLLKNNANVNSYEKNGKTPLTIAIDYQNIPAISILLQYGAKKEVNGKNIFNSCFDKLISAINISPMMNISDKNKNVEDYIISKTNKTTLFKTNSLILEMTMYLFSHQLTTYMNNYGKKK
jgi:ankyrin repeat protein